MSGGRTQSSNTKEPLLQIVQVLKGESTYADAGRQIDEIEQRYLTTVGEVERLQFQRSVARLAFIAATDKGASFETIRERFQARCAFGFDDVFSELAIMIEFAYACQERSQRVAGLQMLNDASKRLAASGLHPNHKGAQELSRSLELCRQRFDTRD